MTSDVREIRAIGAKKPRTLKQLKHQAAVEQQRETASGAYMPTPEEIERMKKLLRDEREAKERINDAEMVSEFLGDEAEDEPC